MAYYIELHFHTAQSSHCGKVSAEEGVKQYRENGYSGIVVTDHLSKKERGGPEGQEWNQVCDRFLEGYYAAKRAVEGMDFRVFLGMEIRFPHDENDFLAYGFTEEFLRGHPWIYMEELSDLMEYAKKEQLYIAQAHPFRSKCSLAAPDYLHGIEVYNGNPRHQSHNDLAFQAAKEHQLGMIAGSDFHQPEDLSDRRTLFAEMPHTEQELAEMLRKGAFTIINPRGVL